MAANVAFMYGSNITTDGLSSGAITVSSESTDFPKTNMQNVYLGKPFKFAVAADGGGLFRVASGDNDTINFNDPIDGAATVTLGSGNYTGTTLAAEVATRMTAAGPTGVYTCTYSTTTGKFTIARTVAIAFGITWTTSKAASLLGYTSNDSGGISYEGDQVRVQSEGYIEFNLGSAQSPTGIFFVGTNFSSNAVIRLYSSAASMIGVISTGDTYREHFDGAGTLEKAFTAGTDFLTDDFNDIGCAELSPATSRQYWTLYISDPTPRSDRLNHEIGRGGIGALTKPSRAWAQNYQVNLADPSPQAQTFGGMLTGQSFPQVRSLVVQWIAIQNSDKDTIELIYRDRPAPLFISGDISEGAKEAIWGQIMNSPQLTVNTAEPSRWSIGGINFRQIPRRQV
jgi:hypothetical protein